MVKPSKVHVAINKFQMSQCIATTVATQRLQEEKEQEEKMKREIRMRVEVEEEERARIRKKFQVLIS